MYLLMYINVSVEIVEACRNWKWVRILQTLHLGVNYCLNVPFVGDSKGVEAKTV